MSLLSVLFPFCVCSGGVEDGLRPLQGDYKRHRGIEHKGEKTVIIK